MPPPGWQPGPDWQPDPSWSTPPVGWSFWIDEPATAPQPQSGRESQVREAVPAPRPSPPVLTQSPPAFPGQPQMPPVGRARRKRPGKRNAILLAIAAIFALGIIASALGGGRQANTAATTAGASQKGTPHPSSAGRPKSSANAVTATTPVATVTASSPVAARKPGFPPTTVAAFRAFAAMGDASQVQQVATSSEGLPSCPQPNFYVIVSPALTGKALEADLSAFFVQNGLLANQCGAAVFAYHSMSDYQANKDNGFTAGRVILTNNSGSSPQFNLEVDTGSATNEQETFNFNF